MVEVHIYRVTCCKIVGDNCNRAAGDKVEVMVIVMIDVEHVTKESIPYSQALRVIERCSLPEDRDSQLEDLEQKC